MGIHDDHAAAVFAAVVSEFVHLEQAMEFVMSRLLGTENNAAGHVCRSIFSPNLRVGIMRALLERAPHNADKPDAYDEIITEFKEVSELRNDYVHGRWETDDNGHLYLVRPAKDPYGLGMLVSEKFEMSEMEDVRRRIMDLWSRIYADVGVEPPLKHHK